MPILVVDDNADIRDLMAMQLRSLGLAADFAKSGQEALDMVKQKKYGAIFMDIAMPGMDGFQATAAIKQYQRTNNLPVTPIVAITGQSDRKECLDNGLDEYVQKPAMLEGIKSVLDIVMPR